MTKTLNIPEEQRPFEPLRRDIMKYTRDEGSVKLRL